MIDFASVFDIAGTALFAVVGLFLLCELYCGQHIRQQG
jgi:hypothetical protein